MSLPQHLEEAASRLQEAAYRIEEARRVTPPTVASLHAWLGALTVYCEALSDLQRINNESVHEKLHALAGHLGLEAVLSRP